MLDFLLENMNKSAKVFNFLFYFGSLKFMSSLLADKSDGKVNLIKPEYEGGNSF